MTWTRNATFAAAAALALGLAGCGSEDSCKAESMDVIEGTLPAGATCSVAPSATVTLSFETCAHCNQANPTCAVDASQPGIVELNPLGEACEAGASCPIPSCGLDGADLRTVSCTFSSPANGTLDVVIFDAGSTGVVDRHVTLDVSGAGNICG